MLGSRAQAQAIGYEVDVRAGKLASLRRSSSVTSCQRRTMRRSVSRRSIFKRAERLGKCLISISRLSLRVLVAGTVRW